MAIVEYTPQELAAVLRGEISSLPEQPNWPKPHLTREDGIRNSATSVAVDAHSQMLAARVEGLEKDINGLQFTWGRIKALEEINRETQGRIERLMQSVQRLDAKSRSETVAKPSHVTAERWDQAVSLLRECANQLPANAPLVYHVTQFLRGR